VSKWANKYVIGLIGNIGTGKSVVRRMLEHLGAYGIDADALGHRAFARGAPGYQPVLDIFGKWILNPESEIDRHKLGRVVFSDPEAMKQLERVVHPLVEQAVDMIIRRSTQSVIVIEAIKLLQTNLATQCDSIWAVTTTPELQLVRLIKNRQMSPTDAQQRINVQPPQDQLLTKAQVIIRNIYSFEDTWRQVVNAWQKNVPLKEISSAPEISHVQGELSILRAKPHHSQELANLINRIQRRPILTTKDDIMANFGEKAFLLCQIGDKPVGLIGWKVENLVSRTSEILIDPAVSLQQCLSPLVMEMERASKDLQSEASLIFAPPDLAKQEKLWKDLGYERRSPQNLGVAAWQEAAAENTTENSTLYFKQLRIDRVLRPI
jgi:dephospho-CoA kinase